MKTLIITLITCAVTISSINSFAAKQRYGSLLCKEKGFTCYKVKSGDSWEKLFPDPEARDVVKRVNRVNMRLRSGWTIAIPVDLEQISHFDVSPFPLKIDGNGHKKIVVELKKLAWGAYDEQGHLIHWGPASGGKGWCSDVGRPCRTHTGNYTLVRKQDYNCTSSKFPLPYGGAAMPYCMHYYKGYALHGSFEVPGYNDSHGCIRMFITDARWLNYDFADYNTKIEVHPY